eukprot:CAMPEP_0197832554 /NCGR_PEP_ID=MMETSP1437-20131217/15267_1 /TAXON_ID=49252 ORGANISM="Eucampia antarctica, Strain CCMP1452" /NCGR_SAMPLE_ID=MMETSP1437 /ASSEMBLY_ACC=CAM_ASM_001096 /LENGTH=290 /DNA_ID=CAMNT_0043435985 /DNA_START=134 /DNA_END=1006 /DNA_ORIENTATION=+
MKSIVVFAVSLISVLKLANGFGTARRFVFPRSEIIDVSSSIIESCTGNSIARSCTTRLFAGEEGEKKKKKLVIWDCDGVLVDSEALLKQGEVEGLAREGITVTTDDCVRLFSGVSPDKAIINFEREMGQKIPPNFFPDQIAGSMDLFQARLQPLMYDTVHDLDSINIHQCIASGSPKDRVELCVDVAGMRPFFPSKNVFTRELVQKGKPAPDLFLHTAQKMGYLPEECIVIEDSSSGIRAAQAAGMEVLGFLGGGHAQADWYVKDIMAFDIPTVNEQKQVYDWILSKIEA